MFIENAALKIEKLTGYDEYGQPAFASAIFEKCAIVKLETSNEQTIVRMNQSPDTGNAHELTAVSKILVIPASKIGIGDKITIAGTALCVKRISPQFDTSSVINHILVEGEIWA